jgi:hypothetical protein
VRSLIGPGCAIVARLTPVTAGPTNVAPWGSRDRCSEPTCHRTSTVVGSAAGYARLCLAGPVGQGHLPGEIARAGATASMISASARVMTPPRI